MKRTIDTDAAPAAVGAYSQGTETDDPVFTAGRIPLTPGGDPLDGADVDGASFGDEPPARSAVEAGALPGGVAVEIEAVATK